MRYPPKVADRGESEEKEKLLSIFSINAREKRNSKKENNSVHWTCLSIRLFGDYCKLKNFLLLNYNFHRLRTMKQKLLQQKKSFASVIKLQIKGFSHFPIRIFQSNLKPVRMLLEVGANGYLYSVDVEYQTKLVFARRALQEPRRVLEMESKHRV